MAGEVCSVAVFRSKAEKAREILVGLYDFVRYLEGLRDLHFIKLTYGQLRSAKLVNETPIALGELTTQKERIKAYPFLDSNAISTVKAWLDSHKDAKDSDRIIEDTGDNLSVVLQTLCKKAGMEIDDHGAIHGKRVRFHCMRKFLIGRLSACAGESQ